MASEEHSGTFKGIVYGDLMGAPYMIENTYNRYFPLGETRRAFSHGKVRTFFPEVTEVSHGATAVCHWLSAYRDSPTAEALQKCLRDQFLSHPRGGWTESTRLFLSSGNGLPSQTPDWAAVTRAVPIVSYVKDDFFRALDLAEACVRATCSDEDTVMMAKALTHGAYMARHGSLAAEIFTTLEMQYGLHLTKSDDDLRAELRGEVRRPLVLIGTPVEGAYRYVLPESPAPPTARLVAEAAVKAVVRSDSWEDAVRKAVAFGGPSNALAGIAGGLAEALYGEVTQTVVGRLFPYIPTDIARQIEAFEKVPDVQLGPSSSLYQRITRDALTVIRVGQKASAIVPEERVDIRRALQKDYPEVSIISPKEKEAFLARYRESRNGTYAYGAVPELTTWYLQDGKSLVSPSTFVAPGMPPLQERKRHLREFQKLRSFCIEVQQELNAAAHNDGAGQIHYGDAFHPLIGLRRIDFFHGDHLAGTVRLNEKGLLKVDLGGYRDLPADARFEDYREQAWASRSLFTIADSSDPVSHMEDIRTAIRERLLDEGTGSGLEGKLDSRYLGEDERRDRSPVSNTDHLESLEPGEDRGIPPLPEGFSPIRESATEGRAQEVRTVYSIGYGMRSREGFINTLHMAGIDTVVDIRSLPRSRFSPQFDSAVLFEALEQQGIAYFEGGDKLGGRPADLSLYDSCARVDWEALRESPSYREGIESIKALAAGGHVVAVVSSEGDPLSSHRFGTVSRTLSEEGMDVRHILPNGEVVSHTVMAARLVERFECRGILRSAFTEPYPVQLAEAYGILNREHGFRMKSGRERGFRARKVKL